MPRIKQPNILKQGLGGLVLGLALVGACVAAWFYWEHHFWTAWKGPTEITLAQLAKLENPSQLPSTWVKVTFAKAVETEVAIEEARIGENVTLEKYLLFQVGDRWMIAVVPAKFRGNVLSGQIYHNNGYMNNDAFAAIYKDYQEVHQGRLFPFEFHAEVDYGSNWTAFPWVLALFAGIGLFFGCLGFVGIRHSFLDPLPASTPEEVDSAAMTVTDDKIANILRSAGSGRGR